MRTSGSLTAWIGCILLLPASAMAQDRTERELVDLIVRDGPRSIAIRTGAEVVRLEQAARLALPNPALLYSREGAGFTEFLQVEQTLPVTGARAALGRTGAAATAAADAERDRDLWRLRTGAATSVARLVAASQLLDGYLAQRRDIRRLVDILQIREREGEGSRFDRLRAEEELRDVDQLVAGAEAAVADLRGLVAGLLPSGSTWSRVSGLVDPLAPHDPVDRLAARATTSHAALRLLAREADRARHEADAARLARRPEPTITAGLKRADDGPARASGLLVGLRMSVPFFDRGGRDTALWDAARVRTERTRDAVEHAIRRDIDRAVDVLAVRRAALAAEDGVSGEEVLRIAELAYSEGEIGILELLDAVRTAARARTRRVEARLDTRLAQIDLEHAVGDVLWP
jgi:outer membrane protein, heavy metal efflux system